MSKHAFLVEEGKEYLLLKYLKKHYSHSLDIANVIRWINNEEVLAFYYDPKNDWFSRSPKPLHSNFNFIKYCKGHKYKIIDWQKKFKGTLIEKRKLI